MQFNERDEWPCVYAECDWPDSIMPPIEVVEGVKWLLAKTQHGKMCICEKKYEVRSVIEWAKKLLSAKEAETTISYKFDVTDRKAYIWLVRDGVKSKKAFFKILSRGKFEATEFAKKYCTPEIPKILIEQMESHAYLSGGVDHINELYISQGTRNKLEELYSIGSEIVFGHPQAQEKPVTIEPDAFTDAQFEPTKAPETLPFPSIKPLTVIINSKLLLI